MDLLTAGTRHPSISAERASEHGVVALSWPRQAEEARHFASQGRPLLLMVEPDADPPDLDDASIDWIRMPAESRDIDARLRALSRRGTGSRPPKLDPFGRLRRGRSFVVLHSPIERRLLGLMLDEPGEVFASCRLAAVGWPDEDAPTQNAMRVHIARMNRRIESLGMRAVGVRNVGYFLEVFETQS